MPETGDGEPGGALSPREGAASFLMARGPRPGLRLKGSQSSAPVEVGVQAEDQQIGLVATVETAEEKVAGESGVTGGKKTEREVLMERVAKGYSSKEENNRRAAGFLLRKGPWVETGKIKEEITERLQRREEKEEGKKSKEEGKRIEFLETFLRKDAKEASFKEQKKAAKKVFEAMAYLIRKTKKEVIEEGEEFLGLGGAMLEEAGNKRLLVFENDTGLVFLTLESGKVVGSFSWGSNENRSFKICDSSVREKEEWQDNLFGVLKLVVGELLAARRVVS